MPSVVEPVSATSACVAPSSAAARSRSASMRSIWRSNHSLLLRPCSSCSLSDASAASNARARHRPVRAGVQVGDPLEDGELGSELLHAGRILGSARP